MERKRGPIPSATARKRAKKKSDDLGSQQLGPSLVDLPFDMTTEILLRLPVKSLGICKGVCKTFNKLISKPHFAKLHLQKSSLGFMIRKCDPTRVSRNMYLLEDEPQEFGSECSSILKLEPTFKLPLRDAKLVLDKQGWTDGLLDCSTMDHRFDLANSCNGLLCLCDPINEDPLVVCNPMTGEFIRLPKLSGNSTEYSGNGFYPKFVRLPNLSGNSMKYSGIGFEPKSNKYKVVRMWNPEIGNLTVEINVVGSPTWRNVGVYRNIVVEWMIGYPTFVNGALHWMISDGKKCSILYFNIETEKLQLINFSSQIFIPFGILREQLFSIGALRDSLYFCNTSLPRTVEVWIMKKYDTDVSWIRAYTFDRAPFRGISLFWAVKHFENGTAMLEYHSREGFFYHNPKNNRSTQFLICATQNRLLEVIPHIPSLVSLKDVVDGDAVEVLNIRSRCAKFQLLEEYT